MLTFNVLFLFVAGLLLLMFERFCRSQFALLLLLIPLSMFVQFVQMIPQAEAGNFLFESHPWLPQLGVNLSFALDGLSLLFALMITGIGSLVVLYSVGYMDRHQYLSRYFSYLFLFMGAMLGMVLADNLIALFVFWEITSITSFLLIGFNCDKEASRQSAITAILVTSAGALLLLFGFVLLHVVTDTYSISEILTKRETIQNSPWFTTILVLMLFGVFTKSAQFPFHFWLPNAMAAPTPVSAYLHSATMVQAGVYLLARVHPAFSNDGIWFTSLSSFGGVTMFVGALLAFKQDDLKLILAYTTVTALGSLVFLLGSSETMVIKAAIAFFISHALYKATLFMVVGDIQHQTGTRDMSQLGGLRKAMPITFLATIVAAASMAGLPPLLGFYVKELVYEAQVAAPFARELLTFIVVMANILVAALAFIVVIRPFLGDQIPKDVKEANKKMSVNAFLLSLLTLVLSIFPFTIDRTILAPAASSILGKQVEIQLSLWHGFTPSLLLSVFTLAGAIITYKLRYHVFILLDKFRPLYIYGPASCWDHLMKASLRVADWQTRILQNGKQRIYLATILSTVAITMLYTMLMKGGIDVIDYTPDFDIFSLFLFTWILSSALAVVYAKTYLRGLVFLGMFGLGIALLFLVDAAPDVAMTQVLVETLLVIIVVLNISRLPAFPKIVAEPLKLRLLNLAIALSFGFTVTLLLLTITHTWFNASVSDFYLQNAVKVGYGHNVVNVILVDFRAIDTLGEVIVVVTAAVGIFALLLTGNKDKHS